jgi:uncharacterized membrane protein YkoI
MKYVHAIFIGLCLAAAVLTSLPSWADSDGEHRGGAHEYEYDEHEEDDEHDHDRALEAVRKGEVMPLEKVLTLVRTKYKGAVVHTKLEREHGAWVYELKILDRNGRMREVYINAKTGKLIKIESD